MASGWMPRIDSALCRRFANCNVCETSAQRWIYTRHPSGSHSYW